MKSSCYDREIRYMNAQMFKDLSMAIKLWLVLKWVNKPNTNRNVFIILLTWDNDRNMDVYVCYEQI